MQVVQWQHLKDDIILDFCLLGISGHRENTEYSRKCVKKQAEHENINS